MKSNTLVIATLAWTASIVGCIDERGASEVQGAVPNAVVEDTQQVSRPVARIENEQEYLDQICKVPLFIGGERITDMYEKEQPSPENDALVKPIEAKI